MDSSRPGFPVQHQLPELAQSHVHWAGDAIQPSHLLSSPSPSAFNLSQHQGLVQWVGSLPDGQSIGASTSASVLPVNIQNWFLLRLTGLISLRSKGLSRAKGLSWRPQFKSINSSALRIGPTLTSIHDHPKNHRFDYMDLCQQSNVSAF